MLVARFIRFYGVATYRDARWPTADGVIPARLFWQLLREVPHLGATEQIDAYYASFLAFAQVMGGKDAKPSLDRALRKLTDLANPMRR